MLLLLVEDAPENDRLGASYAATAAGFVKVISNIYFL